MDERMEHRAPWVPWAVTSVMLLLVAVAFYTFGAHEGAASVAADGDRVWRHGPFPGIFSLFLLFWIFGGLRWMFWGRYCGPWRYRRYGYHSWRDERDDWEEWHRREHERMNMSRGTGTPGAGPGPGAV